jgi:hypothetical protein
MDLSTPVFETWLTTFLCEVPTGKVQFVMAETYVYTTVSVHADDQREWNSYYDVENENYW